MASRSGSSWSLGWLSTWSLSGRGSGKALRTSQELKTFTPVSSDAHTSTELKPLCSQENCPSSGSPLAIQSLRPPDLPETAFGAYQESSGSGTNGAYIPKPVESISSELPASHEPETPGMADGDDEQEHAILDFAEECRTGYEDYPQETVYNVEEKVAERVSLLTRSNGQKLTTQSTQRLTSDDTICCFFYRSEFYQCSLRGCCSVCRLLCKAKNKHNTLMHLVAIFIWLIMMRVPRVRVLHENLNRSLPTVFLTNLLFQMIVAIPIWLTVRALQAFFTGKVSVVVMVYDVFAVFCATMIREMTLMNDNFVEQPWWMIVVDIVTALLFVLPAFHYLYAAHCRCISKHPEAFLIDPWLILSVYKFSSRRICLTVIQLITLLLCISLLLCYIVLMVMQYDVIPAE